MNERSIRLELSSAFSGYEGSKEILQKRYRELIKKEHPDQNGDTPEANTRTRILKEVFEGKSEELHKSQNSLFNRKKTSKADEWTNAPKGSITVQDVRAYVQEYERMRFDQRLEAYTAMKILAAKRKDLIPEIIIPALLSKGTSSRLLDAVLKQNKNAIKREHIDDLASRIKKMRDTCAISNAYHAMEDVVKVRPDLAQFMVQISFESCVHEAGTTLLKEVLKHAAHRFTPEDFKHFERQADRLGDRFRRERAREALDIIAAQAPHARKSQHQDLRLPAP